MTPLKLRVKELREDRNWTQAELAKRAGVSRATVVRIESGGNQRIDLETLEKLGRAFGGKYADAPGRLIRQQDRGR